MWPSRTIVVVDDTLGCPLQVPRTIDSFYGLHVTRDEYKAIRAAGRYWETRVLEEGGSLFMTDMP